MLWRGDKYAYLVVKSSSLGTVTITSFDWINSVAWWCELQTYKPWIGKTILSFEVAESHLIAHKSLTAQIINVFLEIHGGLHLCVSGLHLS